VVAVVLAADGSPGNAPGGAGTANQGYAGGNRIYPAKVMALAVAVLVAIGKTYNHL
jgi:hypothetical protein